MRCTPVTPLRRPLHPSRCVHAAAAAALAFYCFPSRTIVKLSVDASPRRRNVVIISSVQVRPPVHAFLRHLLLEELEPKGPVVQRLCGVR